MDTSVIVPAFSLERWAQLCRAVDSAIGQSAPPVQVIVPIDRNQALLERATAFWESQPLVTVVDGAEGAADDSRQRAAHSAVHGSNRRFGAGVARNTAAALAHGEILAFLDDDAWAEPDWLVKLLGPYQDPSIVAVGGRPLPDYETTRPEWFPGEFDWVFGCAYIGLPRTTAPLRHLIGANMSVRRAAFEAVGGFHSVDFDDLDLCQRLEFNFPGKVFYEPAAVVHHWVTSERVSWRYFWRRCYYVNLHKVAAFQEMGPASNLAAEMEFARSYALKQVVELPTAVWRLDGPRSRRSLAGIAGLALAGIGHAVGRVSARLPSRPARR